jgi:Right handed beta helix region
MKVSATLLFTLCLLLWPLLARATTRYVDPACANGIRTYNPMAAPSSRCRGGSALSYTTIANVMAAHTGGDTILVRAGTYTEFVEYNVLKSGLSQVEPTWFGGYPGETVTLRPNAPGNAIGDVLDAWDVSYVTFDNLILDCSNVRVSCARYGQATASSPGAHYITFQNMTGKNADTNSYFTGNGNSATANDHLTYRTVTVHNCGAHPSQAAGAHGIYIAWSYVTVEYCDISGAFSFGIQTYSSAWHIHHNIVRYNRVHDNGAAGIYNLSDAPAIYNNLVDHNHSSEGSGGGAGDGIIMYGNHGGTVYENASVNNAGAGLTIHSNVRNLTVRDNIFRHNRSDFIDSGAMTTMEHNICMHSAGSKCTADTP